MKKLLKLVLVLAVLFPALADAESLQIAEKDGIKLSCKVPFKFYGFISAQTMWSDSQLSSFGTTSATYDRNMVAVTRVIDETFNDAYLDFTVQNTRIGFALDPYDFGDKNFTVDARLELDFFGLNNGSGVTITSIHGVFPRIRRAYAGIGGQSWRFLAGQEWDLYSPLNTSTLNIGANMWYQGNQGFRRPQMRFTYEHPINENNGLEGAVSASLPSNSMSFTDNGTTTGIPMFQGRFGYWNKREAGKIQAYLSGVFARHINATAGLGDVTNWGLAASLDFPLHKYLNPTAEFQYGDSLGSLLSLSSDTTKQRFMGGWGGIKSAWLGWLETNVGYGFEKLDNSQVVAGSIKTNQLGFLNVKFIPHKSFVIGVEYEYLRTNYQGSGTSSASAIMGNMMFLF